MTAVVYLLLLKYSGRRRRRRVIFNATRLAAVSIFFGRARAPGGDE